MKSILVIGEQCEDVFVYGSCKRLSPEAPVPVFVETDRISNDGMAINVYHNIDANRFEKYVKTSFEKPQKVRYVDEVSNNMLLRVDDVDTVQQFDYSKYDKSFWSSYDCVIISDYDKGFLSEDDILQISKHSKLCFLDTKKKLKRWWTKHVDFIKINEEESKQCKISKFKDKLIITKGSKGATYNGVDFPLDKKVETRDVAGAGDTFLAVLASEYVNLSDTKLEFDALPYAIKCANSAASQVVKQRGVSVYRPNKIV